MPRHQYKRQSVSPDTIYNSFEVAKLINYVTRDGKKSVAQKLVYGMLEKFKKEGQDPMKVLHMAITNVTPNH